MQECSKLRRTACCGQHKTMCYGTNTSDPPELHTQQAAATQPLGWSVMLGVTMPYSAAASADTVSPHARGAAAHTHPATASQAYCVHGDCMHCMSNNHIAADTCAGEWFTGLAIRKGPHMNIQRGRVWRIQQMRLQRWQVHWLPATSAVLLVTATLC
jgi:hypothetical protein